MFFIGILAQRTATTSYSYLASALKQDKFYGTRFSWRDVAGDSPIKALQEAGVRAMQQAQKWSNEPNQDS